MVEPLPEGGLSPTEGRRGEEVLDLPQRTETLAIPADEMGDEGLDPATDVLSAEFQAGSARIRKMPLAIGAFSFVACGIALASPKSTFAPSPLMYLPSVAAFAAVFFSIDCAAFARRLQAVQRRHVDDPRFVHRTRPRRAIAAILVLLVADLGVQALVLASVPIIVTPLDIQVYNGMDEAIDIQLTVFRGANDTLYERVLHIGSFLGTATGVITTARGTYGLRVVTSDARMAADFVMVDPSYFEVHVSIAPEGIYVAQAVT